MVCEGPSNDSDGTGKKIIFLFEWIFVCILYAYYMRICVPLSKSPMEIFQMDENFTMVCRSTGRKAAHLTLEASIF